MDLTSTWGISFLANVFKYKVATNIVKLSSGEILKQNGMYPLVDSLLLIQWGHDDFSEKTC